MQRERSISSIDLVQLRTFVAVAEQKHLTRAAEWLHISQSAASAHVRAVEESLDLQLFVRTNRSLELTRTGELLLAKAKALLEESTVFASFAREMRGKTEGALVVATSSEPGYSRIGEIVAVLRGLHPLISVDLRARHSAGARQGLKTGELDLASQLRCVDFMIGLENGPMPTPVVAPDLTLPLVALLRGQGGNTSWIDPLSWRGFVSAAKSDQSVGTRTSASVEASDTGGVTSGGGVAEASPCT